MSGNIRLSKSSITQKEKDAVCKVLDAEFLGMGEEVKEFEEKIQEYLQTSMSVVCVNSATAALHLALSALDIKEGDEVLVPTITYVASFQAISAVGAKPIPCEVNPETLFIDMNDARKRVTQKTKAIMPVHYASSSKGMEGVYKLANEFHLRVIEDAAQAFGSLRDSQKVGTQGDIICFSFDGIKNITSGEGGAILSNDREFIERVKDARLLGVQKDSEQRFSNKRSWDFDVCHQGFRYHMSNIMAAIGIVQLERLPDFQRKREAIATTYISQLQNVKEVCFLEFDFKEILAHIFVIKAQKRDALREYLLSNSIECGVHYKPNHLLSKYNLGYALEISERLYEEILTLPCHYDLSDEEQSFVIAKIKEFYA